MINKKKGILDRATFKDSMVDDMVDEVDFVDRKNWRPKGGMASDDDSDSDESDYTESQPAHSLEPANQLDKV